MNLVEALKILEIDDINKTSKQDIQKQYRKLMKLNHPDIGGDEQKAKEIIEAKPIVLKAFEQIENYRSLSRVHSEPLCIISILSLVDIYNGKSIPLRFEDSKVELSRKNLSRFKLMLDTSVKVNVDGLETEYNKLFIRNNQDEYEFTIPVNVESLNVEKSIIIKIGDKVVKTNLQNNNKSVMINLGFNINVKINLERKILSN